MQRIFLILALCCAFTATVFAQSSLDKVFQLSKAEKKYERLATEYSRTLLEASNNNIEAAFTAWIGFLQFIDKTAKEESVDINGLKVWIHVFWNPDGTINQLGYLLRPESRFVEESALKALFATVADRYALPVQVSYKFSHYSNATFPTPTDLTTN